MNFGLRDLPGVNAPKRELRNFGLVTGSLFPALFGLLLPWLKAHPFPVWPWIACAILIGAGVAAPAVLRPVYVIWSALGRALGWLNSRIVLTVVFYAVVAPMGLVMRAFGADPMARRFDPEAESYRVASRRAPIKSIERPF